MQPLEITERVKTTYRNYIKTSFPVADDALREHLHSLIDQENLLWRGPFLSLQRPYLLSEKILAELQRELQLATPLLAAGGYVNEHGERHPPFGEWQLFTHQERAVRQILAGENTLVASGT